ncbi:tRNA(fMet)-specific endonuclease VapC [vapC] [Acididesulfobacillus acetoxydans]|uniref:Ribonuclease VapC n=1 Tax=Acididesulfobacillus acetoxydans TaxID=1561005 RepID=A0A8S0X2W3_9FIRM|nr:type II toxin-antitoxin system VapC family toxin [Acididesulfobacillus acetoxydans]CAA7599540.1 tRNA(fMet)-specific endonuclease VapC [vapC] [Acididesulfobacillus acetoxydans]CEJ07735.1 tRNA(fMet)-specific endonuclease VapC [Acididesulfobacillus acetoxydans]
MKYMLDTNICVYLIKKKPENVLITLHSNMGDGVAISAITLAELMHGVEASAYPERNALALNQFLSITDILPFDHEAAAEYGKICAALRRRGIPIGAMDMLIAAHAKAKGLIVVTNNVREFERVEGLEVENWVSENKPSDL